jgi:hypothetical protein
MDRPPQPSQRGRLNAGRARMPVAHPWCPTRPHATNVHGRAPGVQPSSRRSIVPLPATVSRPLPAVASHAIGFAEPRHDTRSQGIGACREDRGSTVDGMAQARYDAVADFYINGFESADDPASVALLDLLGPVTGLRILDVACGHGRITRELARRGADVVGIDISGNLISKARQTEQDEPLGIRYIHADVTAPHVLGGGEFEAVACNFGLSDIDDLDAVAPAAAQPPPVCTRRAGHGGTGVRPAVPARGHRLDTRRTLDADHHRRRISHRLRADASNATSTSPACRIGPAAFVALVSSRPPGAA